jgi:hypothetical protein
MPNIPNITPTINVSREQVINVLLASIALEEIGMAHILNAEGEKLQEIISKHPCLDDLLKIDKSVQTTLKDLIKKEILLEFKFENVLELIDSKKTQY